MRIFYHSPATGGLAAAVGALCALAAAPACRRADPPAPPPLTAQLSGTFETIGVSAPVRIVRDRWGVPHISAATADDLFFAQGFVQAQDRLFQMDLWRRSAQGRLAEVLGPNFIDRDAMTRRMQYHGDPDEEWAAYGAGTKAIAAAFVRGVNAWVAPARVRPPEEFVLAGWRPDFWVPADLLARTDAFAASSDAIAEVFRARLIAAIGARKAADLLPGDRPFGMARGFDPSTVNYVVADAVRAAGAPPFFLGLTKPVTAGSVRLQPDQRRQPDSRLQPDATAMPIPSRRYLVHLTAPGWNVIGATAPWLPGVAIGHNEHVGWEAEGFDADSQDVYAEKMNPANPHQVEENGRWVDTTIVKEAIVVRGRGGSFTFDREYTRHGVVIASDRARNLAFTVRWSGSEPGAAAELASLAIDRAGSAAEFRAALARWKFPARRFTFAGAGGRRESKAAALVPIRRGWNGALPVPAWSGAYEWTGWDQAPAAIRVSPLARLPPDRADALLQQLQAAVTPKERRAIVVNALADALPAPPADGGAIFTHPLAITDAARRRFNVGPLRPPRGDAAAFALTFDPADWDRARAMNAPGQSAAPDSGHYGDLARMWSAGESAPLLFTGSAVQANAETTLTLVPRKR